MTTSPTPLPATPRDSASLLLLRDGDQGLEVLLLRRHEQSRVLGGMYVFPGGKVDAEDQSPAALASLDQDVTTLHARLGEPGLSPALAAGLFLAALREAQEEAGIWLADRPGQPDMLWRTADVLPWSRWITPVTPAIGTARFDTRFFLARLPQGQEAQHDNHEATESVWVRPREGLERYWAGEIGLIPPQLMGLAQLSRHSDVASAWAEALAQPVRCILPEVFKEGDVRVMCYPGDPAHPLRAQCMPGPTRLRMVGKRFEPVDGFDGWFA
jgi:8-oxo-dGTP pyrophosphatase MutT (NUDIX family)